MRENEDESAEAGKRDCGVGNDGEAGKGGGEAGRGFSGIFREMFFLR